MTNVIFYKVSSNGETEIIDSDVSSLHTRRSIIVEDNLNKILYLFNGKSVSKKTGDISNKIIKEMNSNHGFEYEIITINYDVASDKLIEILEGNKNKEIKKEVEVKKEGSIPKIPSLPQKSKEEKILPKGDLDGTGPQIEEFQISYYEGMEQAESGESISSESGLELGDLVSLINEVYNISKKKPNRRDAERTLIKLVNKIIISIYE
ncbi:MAG: hypothetical protein OEZ01_10875 [Candidatus Heimdallarchaeota archaeon]|nr:hypothetical protein [Candidatus Heimdallarchaeota archaeon]